MSRFKDIGHAWLDTQTGLEWEKNQPKDRRTWEEAIEYCGGLRDGGFDDWRLPTKDELLSIVDNSMFTPATDLPEVMAFGYWSSTIPTRHNGCALIVSFYYGSDYIYGKPSDFYVRAVRGEKAGGGTP